MSNKYFQFERRMLRHFLLIIILVSSGSQLNIRNSLSTIGPGNEINELKQQDISPEDKGLTIAVEADKRDTGFGDFTVDLAMILKNSHGEESSRQMRNKVLEVPGDGDKSLFIFDRPRDIKGTALLTYSHKDKPDDQWIFLPALNRVKRITTSNKSGPFMGSEFAFEDLSSEEVEKYTYRFIRNEIIEEIEYFVIERYPRDLKSGYNRQIVWYTMNEYRIHKIEYYDRKDDLLKTLTYLDYRLYLGMYWRASEMLIINHQTGKSTRSLWSDFRFNSGLAERDFDPNALRRIQ
ncbi:outer membrane lipoprotein-sorting protein [candidate division KSB1 bacterium]